MLNLKEITVITWSVWAVKGMLAHDQTLKNNHELTFLLSYDVDVLKEFFQWKEGIIVRSM